MKSSIAPGFPAIGCLAAAVALVATAAIFPAHSAAKQASGTSIEQSTPTATAAPQQSNPRSVAATVARVQALRKDGQTARALEVLQDALKAAPRDAQLRFLYGVTMAESGRRDDAIALFEQLAADFPELPEPHNNLAVMYAAAGDLDRARAALENAVRALPDYALAHENLGDLYLRMATRSWERASHAAPRDRSAPAKLALARELMQRIAPTARQSTPAASPQPATDATSGSTATPAR